MTKTRSILVWLLMAPVVLAAESAAEKSPAMLFQEAQYQEQTAGDLDKAIELYQKVVTDAAEMEKLAGRATFQLGMCYLKKDDKTKAAGYFKKIISEYSAQKELVAQARKQLKVIDPALTVEDRPYIVWFKAPGINDAKQLLSAFNAACPSSIESFRFRTEQKGDSLVGNIHVNDAAAKDAIAEAFKMKKDVIFIKAEPVYTIVFKSAAAVTNEKELLDAFNVGLPQGVDTYKCRSAKLANTLHLYLSTDTKEEKDKLVERVKQEPKLQLVEVLGPRNSSDGGFLSRLPQSVLNRLSVLYGEVCAESGAKRLFTNCHIHFVNAQWEHYKGGYGYFMNQSETPLNGPIFLGRTSGTDIEYYTHVGKDMVIEFVKDEKIPNAYRIMWMPDTPIAPWQLAMYAWSCNGMDKIVAINGEHHLTMQNHYGDRVFEVFYLIMPDKMAVTAPVENYTVKDSLDGFTIYGWQKDVPENTEHVVEVVLSQTSAEETAADIQKIVDSFEEGTDTPNGWTEGAAVEGVEYLWDKTTAKDGKASLCLKKTANKYFPIAQWSRQLDYKGGASFIEVKTQVKAQAMTKAIVDVLFLDQNGQWIRHDWLSYIGDKSKTPVPVSHDWKSYDGKAKIPVNTETIVVGLQIYGPGTVWFDQLEITYGSVAESQQAQAKPVKPDKLRSEDLSTEGWKLWQERKLTEAEQKFEEAIAVDPVNENAYQGLGWAQLNQGKKNNAEVSFKKCIELNPKNAAALNGLGWIAQGNGDVDSAILWWEKAVKVAPTATAALSGLAQAYMDKEDYRKAAKYYMMWLKAEPNNQEAKEGLEKAKQAAAGK